MLDPNESLDITQEGEAGRPHLSQSKDQTSDSVSESDFILLRKIRLILIKINCLVIDWNKTSLLRLYWSWRLNNLGRFMSSCISTNV